MEIRGNVYYAEFGNRTNFQKRVFAALGIASLLIYPLNELLIEKTNHRKLGRQTTIEDKLGDYKGKIKDSKSYLKKDY